MEGFWDSLGDSVRQLCDLGSHLTGMDTDYLEEIILQHMQEGADYLQSQAIPNVLSGSVKYVKEIAAVGGFLLLFVVASVFLAKDYDNIIYIPADQPPTKEGRIQTFKKII